jgi:hypothetical protein
VFTLTPHANAPQSVTAPQSEFAPQVCTSPLDQRELPGAHTAQ